MTWITEGMLDMTSKTRNLASGALALLLLALLASMGCGGDTDSSCSGCRINGSFYSSCLSDPSAYCAFNQPCSIALNVCS